ncbi:unnamed protein product [Diamesa serratosioi]
MTARYNLNSVDQVIMLHEFSDDEKKGEDRECPPTYSTLPRSGESKKHNMEKTTEPTSLMRTARRERSKNKRLKRIFRSYDDNGDGFLEKRELKKLITSNPDEFEDVAKALSQASLTMKSSSKMSFEQFLNFIEDHEDFEVNDFVEKFSRALVLPRDDCGFDVKPKGFTFYIPIMVIFSLIQISFFLYDFITKNNEKNQKTLEGNLHFNSSIDFMDGDLSKMMKVSRNTEGSYRYFTYQFTHMNVYHLIGNVLVQLLLGIPLEFMHGSWRIITVYFAGVLSGSVGHVLFNKTYLGGASGGVYALGTAHIASVLMNWKAMRFAFIHLLVFVSISGKAVYDGIANIQKQREKDPAAYLKVSDAAHIGGAFAGLLVGIGMLRNYNSSKSKRVFWMFCVAIYCTTMIAGIIHIHCDLFNDKRIVDKTSLCFAYETKLNETIDGFNNFTINALIFFKKLVSNQSVITTNSTSDWNDPIGSLVEKAKLNKKNAV